MKPYSLYQYRNFDGRIGYRLFPRTNCLLLNVAQLDVLYNPQTRCTLVLMSFEKDCKLTFDARYTIPDYGDLIAEGNPLVFEIDHGLVDVGVLNPQDFFNH